MKRFPDNVWVATHHATVASNRRDRVEALHRWQHVKAQFPDHWPGYIGLAQALRETGKLDDADYLLTDATERFSNNEWVAIDWARSAMERQDWPEALRRWDTVLQRFPRNALAHTGRAEAQTSASAREEASARPRLAARRIATPDTKFSAYLSVYNDWDILEPALRSMKPFVDELVVVDGGYTWMAGFLDAIGHNPEKSEPQVYEAIEAAGIPFRVISRMWKSELEKRLAGYMACHHRFIYRIDADEIMHFDENLDAFLRAGGAVANMEMPLYMAPGWIIGRKDDAQIERQCFLFDSKQVSPEAHLSYLWLVLTLDQLPQVAERLPVFPAPVAFNAHLSLWRRPATSITRAAFYSLNYIRAHGAPWITALGDKPLPDLAPLFEHAPPKYFLETLYNHDAMMGYPFRDDDWLLKPSPLSQTDEAGFSHLHDNLLGGLARANEAFAASGRYFVDELKLDLSSDVALQPLLRNGEVALQFSADLSNAEVWLDYILPAEPWTVREPVPAIVERNRLTLSGLSQGGRFTGWLRRALEVRVRFEDGWRLQRAMLV